MKTLYVGEVENHRLKYVQYYTMYWKTITREKIRKEKESLKPLEEELDRKTWCFDLHSSSLYRQKGKDNVVSVLFSYDVPFPELLSTQVVVKFIGRSCTTEHCNIMKGPCEPCMRSEFYPIPGPGQRAMSGQRLDWEL